MIKIYFDVVTEPIPKLYETLMKRVIRTAVSEAYPEHRFEVNVTVCDDEEIREINKEHRGIDRATDVLSFPLFEESGGKKQLGDIVLSLERCAAQAEEFGHSFERECAFLTVHSTLHLLGYDHVNGEEEEFRYEALLYVVDLIDRVVAKG